MALEDEAVSHLQMNIVLPSLYPPVYSTIHLSIRFLCSAIIRGIFNIGNNFEEIISESGKMCKCIIDRQLLASSY